MPTRRIWYDSEPLRSAGDIALDTDDNLLKFMDPAGSSRSAVTEDQTQTLTNKTLTSPALTTATLGGITGVTSLDFTGTTPAQSPISFSGVTLAASTNAIRGVSVTPTRVSGWTCFTGTLDGVSAYTDYRELRTAGTDIVYGGGYFGFMDSGASCNTILSLQAITTASSGSTLTTASGSPLAGAYAAQFKMLFDGATFNSGAITAVACFLYQSNVTDISGGQSSILQLSVDSGLLQNVFHINSGASVIATNLFNFGAAVSPLTTGGSGTPTAASGTWYNLRCSINGTPAYIPISTAAWTNA